MKVYDAQATCEKVFTLAGNRGWSDAKLARILDVTPQAISKWRRGVGSPSTDMIVMLADLFGVPLDELIGSREINMKFHLSDGFEPF